MERAGCLSGRDRFIIFRDGTGRHLIVSRECFNQLRRQAGVPEAP
jgi:hypothetical protein